MSTVRFDQDRESARWFDTDRVAVAWFDRDLAAAGGAPPPRTLDSSAALPLGGTIAGTIAIAAQSSRGLPFAAVSDFDNPIVFEEGPPEQLPLGGTSEFTLAVAMGSSAALPFGGTATFVSQAAPTAGGAAPYPFIMRRQEREREKLPRPRVPRLRLLSTVARLPLGGEVILQVEPLPSITDEELDEILAALV